METTLRKETLITRQQNKVEITLIEIIDNEIIELGLDLKLYKVKVECKDFDIIDEYKYYLTKTNAEKSYLKTLAKIRNLYC